VAAVDSEKNTRRLQRRSEVFLGDTITTGPMGVVQIRLVDGAMFALKEDTGYLFKTYDYDGDSSTPDSAVMEMVRGGFRTISGSIGDSIEDTYRIETQFANIGVRGTVHEAVIAFGQLFTGVYEGGTTVTNALGSIDTGLGGDFDYAVTSDGEAPQGLLQQPGQLRQISIINVGLDADEDNGNDDDGNGGDGNGGSNNDGDAGNNNGGGNNDGGAGNNNGGV